MVLITFSLLAVKSAPVAQGIEHRPPEAGAQVRILSGAPRVEKGANLVRGITPTFLVTADEVRENKGAANHSDFRGAIFLIISA